MRVGDWIWREPDSEIWQDLSVAPPAASAENAARILANYRERSLDAVLARNIGILNPTPEPGTERQFSITRRVVVEIDVQEVCE